MEKRMLEFHTYSTEEAITMGALLGVNAVRAFHHGGMQFVIAKIEPKLVGASVRNYELFVDGYPHSGGRYHMSLQHAMERAEFVAESYMSDKITRLWSTIDKYRKEQEADRAAMRCALEVLENIRGESEDDGTIGLLRERLEDRMDWDG